MPHDGAESWTLVDDGSSVVAPAEAFLAHLAAVERRSPNTVRAYAHELRAYFAFLVVRGLDWGVGPAGGSGRVRGCGCRRGRGKGGGGAALGDAVLLGGDDQPQAADGAGDLL